MKILIDTNILISAALFPHGTPAKAFFKAVTPPNTGIICTQNIEELKRIFQKKFPDKSYLLEHFLAIALLEIQVIPIPDNITHDELLIRDVKDRPILRAAISANADILLTGDKDFLESEVHKIKILNASDFCNFNK